MEMQRRHLERAVLLSLLLANVCRTGGATEYNTQITGNESGYESIKVIDSVSGDVTYTFAGENTLKGNISELPFRPILVTDKNVTIDIGDKLTTIGEEKGAVMYASEGGIMAYSSYANLTFTGGELNIKDLTAGTNGAYLVKATEGGSIIFDNTVVDIGAGNNTTSSIGLQSAGQGSKISFGKNVEQLTIKSATGIVVEGGGSLEFNSVDGIINIGRDEGSKKGHDGIRVGTFSGGGGGNITLAGKETNIKVGSDDGTLMGNAVSIRAYSDTDNSILNFNAAKTTLQASAFGVIVEKGPSVSQYTGETAVNFAGETVIKAINNCTGDSLGAKALASYQIKSTINFAEHVSLWAETAKIGGDRYAFGAQIEKGSILKALAGMEVTAKANDSKAVGLGAYGTGSLIDITGDTVISSESISGKGTGIQGWVGSRVDLDGALNVTAKSGSGDATGLWSWDHSQINVGGDAVIGAVSDSGAATGINSNDSGSSGSGDASLTQINGKAVISASGSGATMGIFAYDNGAVVIDGGADLVAASSNNKATGINSTSGGTVKIEGITNLTAQSATNNAIGIDGTVELDSARIFVEAAGEGTGIQNWSGAKVIFNDDAQIIIDAAGNNAKGIYGWNGSLVNFAGDAAIKIGGVEGSAKEAYYVRAITAMTNSTVNVGGDAIFELEGSDTIGLDLSDNSAVNVDGNVVTSAKATTGSVKGIGAANSSVTIGGDCLLQGQAYSDTVKGIDVNNGSVKIAGIANIIASSSGSYGNGINTQQSTVKLGSANIKVGSESTISSDNSLGIYSYWDTTVTVDGDALLEVTADKNNVLGLAGYWNSITAIGKSAQITVSSKQGTATGIKGESSMTTAIDGNAVITATGAGVATGVVTDSTSNFTVGRDAVITAQSTDGAEAFGIDGGAAITGSAKVTVSSLGGKAENNKELWHINGIKNWNSGTTTKISGDTVIDVTADISSAKGVYLWNGSKAEIGGNAVVTVKNAAGSIIAHGLNADADCSITVGKAAQINVEAGSNNIKGIYSHENGGSVTVGESAYINVGGTKNAAGQVTAEANYARGITGESGGKVMIGGDAFVSVSGISARGIEAFRNKKSNASVPDAKVAIAGNYGALVRASAGEAFGIVTDNGGNVSIGGNAAITVISTEGDATGLGNYHYDTADGRSAGRTEINGAAHVNVASTGNGGVWGIYNYNGAVTEIGSAADELTVITVSGNRGSEMKGIEAMLNSSVTVHGAALIDVCGDQSTEVVGVIAGRSGDTKGKHSAVAFGDTAYIKIGHNDTAFGKARADGESFGVVARSSSKVDFNGDAVIDTSGTVSGGNVYGAYAQSGGSIDFKKGLVLDNQGKKHSLYVSGTDSNINVNSGGSGDVYLKGDITAINEGTLQLDLASERSYFAGAATTETNGKLHMKLRHGALWDLTADSKLSSLVFEDGAMLDMAQAAGYQNLRTDSFTGSGATFVLGTDIHSDQSDKVYITGSTPTGTVHHNIQIKDAGRNIGENLHLLLVDDASGNYTFTAQDAYGGGIYNYKAEFSNEVNGGIKWYLESLKVSDVTQDVKALGKVGTGIYSLVVTGNDSLRSRLGELREDVDAGVWARVYGGRLKGDSFTENYQTYQLGYDMPFSSKEGATADWIGGAAVEYSKGNIGYGVGSGENKMSALALYAARHTKSGDNVDIILKHGWVKGDIETYGIGADDSDYDTNSTSLSVEYNKRLAQKNNTFIEPQLQLTLTHINGNEFTTRRGIKVSSDGIDSAIGRLGLAFGRQYRRGQIYFKASALHEFGGSGNVQMTSLGESYSESINYSGTWCELALGGNVQLAENNNLYFDVTRSFGGDFQKQWQVNAGLRWSF